MVFIIAFVRTCLLLHPRIHHFHMNAGFVLTQILQLISQETPAMRAKIIARESRPKRMNPTAAKQQRMMAKRKIWIYISRPRCCCIPDNA